MDSGRIGLEVGGHRSFELEENFNFSGGLFWYKPYQDLNRGYMSGAKIVRVGKAELPNGVLGLYDSINHTISVRNDLTGREERFVREHEDAHGLGLRDEMRTDGFASSRTGYNLRPLGEFKLLNT